MKKNNATKKNIPPAGELSANNQNRPQNKDNLDSRTGEEQTIKGKDITHNRKDKKSENKK